MKKKLICAVSCLVMSFGMASSACADDVNLQYTPPDFVSSGNATFDEWRKDFAARAVNVYHKDPMIIEDMLNGVTPNNTVVKLNNSQPEFIKTVGDYISSAVSTSRINQGKANYQSKIPILSAYANQYGVPLEVAIAIWGMETSYGANTGSSDVIRALATLAYDGRRRQLGETELLAVADILKNGDASKTMLKGSWAGAMGHTQFMPSSYLKWAVDGDNDGKKDIWSDENDAVASTLNYLSSVGWKRDEPWGKQVGLVSGFDYSLANGTMHSIEFWRQNGIYDVDNSINVKFPDGAMAYLLLPMGANGPKFLVGSNFKAIKHYNNSDSYALSVGLLADMISGKIKMPSGWEYADKMVTRSQAIELQQILSDFDYDVGGIDGAPGTKTKLALQQFQKSQGMIADGYPSVKALRNLKIAAGLIDPDAPQTDLSENNDATDSVTMFKAKPQSAQPPR